MSIHTKGPRILLIDDQPEQMQPLKQLLESVGFRFYQAYSAWSGYQRAQALQPDVILLDLYMPEMDGFAVCRLLRETASTRHIPVLFLSSAATAEQRVKGFELGGEDFIIKPFVPEEALARIRVVLRSRPVAAPAIEPAEAPRPRSQDEIFLQAAIRLIDEQLATPPSLAELARAVGTNEKRLLKVFRERLGTTVFGYVRQQRMDEARRLLQEPAVSIEEIAAQIGFSSAANFSTAFRQAEGLSPSQYRQALSSD